MSPQQRAQIQARLERVNAERSSVNAPSVAPPDEPKAKVSQDRHKSGYMADYMRKRRAKKAK